MTHPDAFPLACAVFRLCGFGVEPQGEDGELARVIDVPSAAPLGWICEDGAYQPQRIPAPKPAMVAAFVALVLRFCASVEGMHVPLPVAE